MTPHPDLADGIDYPALLRAVAARFPLGPDSIHGPDHWARVAAFGARLAAATPGCDATVVRLFALFHDSCRQSDHDDPGHGARGAALAAQWRGALYRVTEAQFEALADACVRHTDGLTTGDPTVGACWDADRLDLMRAGIAPDPLYMSTTEARRPGTIRWATELSTRSSR